MNNPVPKNTQAQPIENDILLKRLIMREGGHHKAMRGTLSKCIMRYRDFILQAQRPTTENASTEEENEELSSSSSPMKAKELATSLKRELQLNGLEVQKIQFMALSAEAELSEYHTASTTLEESILKSKQEIENLKRQLHHEKKVRRNLEEYEQMANLASKYPSRRASSEKLTSVKRKMETIQAEESQLNVENDIRKKQFQILLQSLFDLSSSLEEDKLNNEELEDDTSSALLIDVSQDLSVPENQQNCSSDVVMMDTS